MPIQIMPPSRKEGLKHLEKLMQEVGLDDQTYEAASRQILSALKGTDVPTDPSPFTHSVQAGSSCAIKKIPKSQITVAQQVSRTFSMERSSSEASCVSPLVEAATQFKDEFNLKDILNEATQPMPAADLSEQQQTDKDWKQIVERMSIVELLNAYFANCRNIQLQREVNRFIEQFEDVACFSLMNYMKDGLILSTRKSTDLQIASFMAGFSLGINHANQTSIEKSILALDVLIKQTQHYLVDQRDAMETLHQNTDVLQQNIQLSIGEMNKLRELPDKLSDVLDSAKSQYDTPRACPPVKVGHPSQQPAQAQMKQPQYDDHVIVTIHGIQTKICKEAPGQERIVRMNAKYKSYFEERPHMVSTLKTLPWTSLKSCDGTDISIYFPDK